MGMPVAPLHGKRHLSKGIAMSEGANEDRPPAVRAIYFLFNEADAPSDDIRAVLRLIRQGNQGDGARMGLLNNQDGTYWIGLGSFDLWQMFEGFLTTSRVKVVDRRYTLPGDRHLKMVVPDWAPSEPDPPSLPSEFDAEPESEEDENPPAVGRRRFRLPTQLPRVRQPQMSDRVTALRERGRRIAATMRRWS